MGHEERDLEKAERVAAVSGFADPAGEVPWAMQLVVDVPKSGPPDHNAVCEAAAMAVAAVCERAETDPEWGRCVERWEAGRIRKLVRRARGAQWDRVCALAGETVEHRGARVRAFVPSATDDVAAEIAKLQVTGLELDDVYTRVNELCATEHITVSVCPEPKLSTGKAAAACGHAAQVARKKMAEQDPERFERWRQARWAVVVEPVATEEFEVLRAHAQVVIVDAGFTEIDPNTTTAVAYW